jgi:hypothetical protein
MASDPSFFCEVISVVFRSDKKKKMKPNQRSKSKKSPRMRIAFYMAGAQFRAKIQKAFSMANSLRNGWLKSFRKQKNPATIALR